MRITNIFVIASSIFHVHCELFSSLGHLKDLFQADQKLLRSLKKFIEDDTEKKMEEEKLDEIKK